MSKIEAGSDIAGRVFEISANIGDHLQEDDPVIVLEAMKMEIAVSAPRAGVLREILVGKVMTSRKASLWPSLSHPEGAGGCQFAAWRCSSGPQCQLIFVQKGKPIIRVVPGFYVCGPISIDQKIPFDRKAL